MKITRRGVFSAIAGMFGALPLIGKPKCQDVLKSVDAKDWAVDFVAHVNAKPSIATDLETMETWFANAIFVARQDGLNWAYRRKTLDERQERAADILRVAHGLELDHANVRVFHKVFFNNGEGLEEAERYFMERGIAEKPTPLCWSDSKGNFCQVWIGHTD